MSRIAMRTLLIASALVIAGWLAFGLRAAALEEEGVKALDRAQHGTVPSEQLAGARDALGRASRLNPDQGPDLTEGLLLAYAGRRSQAYAFASRLVAKEPEDFNDWYLLYLTHPRTAGIEDARRRVRELNPLLGARLRRPRAQRR